MMRRDFSLRRTAVFALLLFSLAWQQPVWAYWIWSPDLGRWINPRKSAKDTPEKQMEWAQRYFQNKDWDRAVEEFEKVPDTFPNSKLAAEAVYFIGICWEEKRDWAKAADAYQRLIDRYPYSDRIRDGIKREYDIAVKFAAGDKVKVWGVPALPGQDKALELFKHIVKNAPFGGYGADAQFQIGLLYKSQGEYEEARKSFQAVVDEYPDSEWTAKARYEVAVCSMEASRHQQYDERGIERAIEEFQGFKENYPATPQSVEADETVRKLREEKALSNLAIAEFYDRLKKWNSAKVYYQEVIKRYPETEAARQARKRVQSIVSGEAAPEAKAKKFWLFG